MTALELILLFSLCFTLAPLIVLSINYIRLEKVCKHLLKMNSDLFLEMLKLSEVEDHDQNPFDEFKGENH